MAEQRFPHAAAVYANYAQFSPGERLAFPRVESRMLLWCKAGQGGIVANGLSIPLQPDWYVILPWGHRIVYAADARDPFLLGGAHVIPRHAPTRALRYDVAHGPTHPLAGAPGRRDLAIAALATVKQGRLAPGDPLAQLAEHIVGVFLRGDPPAWQARHLGACLLRELTLAAANRGARDAPAPVELERLKEFVRSHLRRPLSLRDLVEFSGLSPSTVGRLFREHLGVTPVEWIHRVKIGEAARLLRTRRVSVAEAGAAVGIADPHYFAKCFRTVTGQPPRACRQTQRWL